MPLTLRACVVLAAVLLAAKAGAAEPTKAQCIAANEGAQDLRGAGKLLEARAQLALCVSESCPGAVRQDCAQRLADVDKALPSLVLVAKDAAGNDLGGVRATIDGKPLADALNGSAVPVDPGEHHLVLESAGLASVAKTLILHEGEKGRREVVVFGEATGGATRDATPEPGASPSPPEQRDVTSAASPPGDTQRKVAIVLGAVGAVGLVVGGIFGIVAKSSFDHAKGSECGTSAGYASSTTCTQAGANDVQGAYDQATVANVGMIAGAALLGAGAYFYLSAPKAGEVAIVPTAGPGSAGLSMRGAW
jgi:hypothetical protein